MIIFQAVSQKKAPVSAKASEQAKAAQSGIYGPKPTPADIRKTLGPAASIYCSSELVSRLQGMDNTEDRAAKIKEIQSAISVLKNRMPKEGVSGLLEFTKNPAFFSKPTACAELANNSKSHDSKEYLAKDVFFALTHNEALAAEFMRDPDKVKTFFSELIKNGAGEAALAINNVCQDFKRNSDLNASEWLIRTFSDAPREVENAPVERNAIAERLAKPIQKPADALYKRIEKGDKSAVAEWKKTREDYISTLSEWQVIGLLASGQEFYFGSTTSLLFDRLNSLLDEKKVSLSGLFKGYGIKNPENSKVFRQLVFASIQHENFGSANSIVQKEDLELVLKMLAKPLFTNPKKLDTENLYYLSAAIDTLKGAGDQKSLQKIYSELASYYLALKPRNTASQKKNDFAKTMDALKYLVYQTNEKTDILSSAEKKSISNFAMSNAFSPNNFLNNKNELCAVQIYDKEDAEAHFNISKEFFTKKFDSNPVIENTGLYQKCTFRKGNKVVVLFMGNTHSENQSFVADYMKGNKNAIFAFRGHTGSLMDNVPPSLLGNQDGNVMAILGNCKSVKYIPDYVAANPATKINVIANRETGRGKVTDDLVMGIMEAGANTAYEDIIQSKKASIALNEGNVDTLAIGGSAGVINYINRKESKS